MYLHGHFYNQKDERIEVHILTNDDRTKEIVIGGDCPIIKITHILLSILC